MRTKDTTGSERAGAQAGIWSRVSEAMRPDDAMHPRCASFRVGDRVRATRESWGDKYAPVGAVGTIGWCPNYPSVLPVTFDGHPAVANGDGTTSGWAMFGYQIEHVHGPVARTLRRMVLRLRGHGQEQAGPAPVRA